MPLRTRRVRLRVSRTIRRLPPGKVTTRPPRRTNPRVRADTRTRTLSLLATAACERDTTSTRTGGSAARGGGRRGEHDKHQPCQRNGEPLPHPPDSASGRYPARRWPPSYAHFPSWPPSRSPAAAARQQRLGRRARSTTRSATCPRTRRWWSRSTPTSRASQFKAIGKIVDRFPFANQIESQLKQRLESGGGFDYEDDLKPLLGNEFVVGATDVRSIVDRGDDNEDFVGAIQVKDKGKLEDALEKEKAKEAGEKSGAKLYEDDDGDAFAIEDDVLVVAELEAKLEAALEQRDADDRLTEETFDKGTDGPAQGRAACGCTATSRS